MINLEYSSLFLTTSVYLTGLFILAHCAEKGFIPERIIKHPLIYVLSLGVSISTWSFYTSLVSASDRGYGYTAYYIGYSAAFLFTPILLQPIFHITRTYQLSSLADLFAFRFRSPWAGTLTTVVLLLCIFPLLFINYSIIEASIHFLVPAANAHILLLLMCLLMTVFTILYGASDVSGRDHHQGIVVAMAFDSVLKLSIFLILAVYVVYEVFGGFSSMNTWLQSQPEELARLDTPFRQTPTNLVILLFFTAAVTMPHMFHMVFRENSNPENLRIASWGVPLMLLVISLPVLPILWAANFLNATTDLKFSSLAIGMLNGSSAMTLAVFLGGLAAAFGVVVILTMAVSGMCVNHLLLPLKKPDSNTNLYKWLLVRRQLFIAAIIIGGYLCYLTIAGDFNSSNVTFVPFIACAQFLPGLLTLLYWPGGNSKGFIAGVIAGVAVWIFLGLIPMFTGISFTDISYSSPNVINWSLIASLSIFANFVIHFCISLISKTSIEEKSAARMCISDASGRPNRVDLIAKTPQEFIERLAVPVGKKTATREVKRALHDLGLNTNETRPHSLFQLRNQLEANLSGLLGPTLSHSIIEMNLQYTVSADSSPIDVNFIENRLEAYPGNLSGVALDLDKLRRHHRQILQDLPIGVCSLDSNAEIAIWNSTMEELTKISSESIKGCSPSVLIDPWRNLLIDFIADTETPHVYKQSVLINDKQHWLSLHKAHIEKGKELLNQSDGLVILVEDLTETELLESELAHSERLASIGRLAAGVAHEIGNPITGIACLAQNIRDETNNTELRLMAEQIIEQTNRTSRIVKSLVSFSHSGKVSGHLQLDNKPVSIYQCIDEAIQLLSLNQRSKDIIYSNECSINMKVFCDKQRVQQIFVNLLSNARDASTEGTKITVTDSINNDKLLVTVTDHGSGIPTTVQDRIFEPFFTTKDPGKGTGLGLSLVYSIVEDLGGSIQIISPVDKVGKTGTRVIVTFPCYHDKSPID